MIANHIVFEAFTILAVVVKPGALLYFTELLLFHYYSIVYYFQNHPHVQVVHSCRRLQTETDKQTY